MIAQQKNHRIRDGAAQDGRACDRAVGHPLGTFAERLSRDSSHIPEGGSKQGHVEISEYKDISMRNKRELDVYVKNLIENLNC